MTNCRIIIAIAPTRHGRFAVYHEADSDVLNIERTFATTREAEDYADGVVAGLRACGRTTSVPLFRNP